MNIDLNDPRFTAIGLLTEAYSGLMARLSAQIEEHGLKPVEFEVLIRLARSPDNRLRMTDLAGQTSLSTSGVTRAVDRVERDGLVRREACRTDRRSAYAVITPAGLQRLHEVLPGQVELLERWYVGLLSETQLAGLQEALRVIRDAVHPCAVAGAEGTTAPEGACAAPTGRTTGRTGLGVD